MIIILALLGTIAYLGVAIVVALAFYSIFWNSPIHHIVIAGLSWPITLVVLILLSLIYGH